MRNHHQHEQDTGHHPSGVGKTGAAPLRGSGHRRPPRPASAHPAPTCAAAGPSPLPATLHRGAPDPWQLVAGEASLGQRQRLGTRTTSGLPAGTTGWMAKRYTRAHTCMQID
ncbi:hypothetical protein GCM10018980_74260 [Streptomyces capoamus]|uniref:Uncharacterized protein n=1 Tax=Streptomyces capoamus TaxID=68183 RepID=A0A919KG40_9ACTN|nr:hypothetical protein GCM10010501_75600 [Streptomyces libani subsp. rufus]GHG76375.1 hypothetical protein GCM10018980_74260 [Streptomyces capoamus]